MKPPKKLDAEELMNFAGRTLARRAQSLNEVRARLRQRAGKPEDVEEVISRLKQAGLLNDRQFADSFARGRKENRGFGKARVMRDLMARRVAPAVAKQAAESTYAEADEVELISGAQVSRQGSRRIAGGGEQALGGLPPLANSGLQRKQFPPRAESL